jgi:hypothetical protein
MKTLTATAIIAALSLSTSAFAGSDFWTENNQLLERHSNPNDISYVQKSAQTGSDFWVANGAVLERNANANDDSYNMASAQVLGSQPEVGSGSVGIELMAHRDFFATYGDLLERRHNPAK